MVSLALETFSNICCWLLQANVFKASKKVLDEPRCAGNGQDQDQDKTQVGSSHVEDDDKTDQWQLEQVKYYLYFVGQQIIKIEQTGQPKSCYLGFPGQPYLP